MILIPRMNIDKAKELLEKFCQVAQTKKGSITIEEFAEYLGLPRNEHLQEMFALYDRVSVNLSFRLFWNDMSYHPEFDCIIIYCIII